MLVENPESSIENPLLCRARIPFAEYVFAGGFFYLGHVAVEPDGHRHPAVAKAFLNRLGEVTQSSAVAPLRQVDIVAGPDVKHISVVVELLLDMILKCNHFAVTFEFEVDFLVCYVPVKTVRAICEVLLRGQSPGRTPLGPVIHAFGAGAAEYLLVLGVFSIGSYSQSKVVR